MAFAQDHASSGATAEVLKDAREDETFPRAGGTGTGTGDIITILGHLHFTFQTVEAGGDTPTVLLEGSNDRVNWTTLATHVHAGDDAKFSEISTKPYKYVRANKSVDGAGAGAVDYFLRAAGASGIY